MERSIHLALSHKKIIYNELLLEKSRDHVYQSKWVLEIDDLGYVDWDEVWGTIHSQFHSERIKITIWEQIHLNFYTTYNYNKWHNELKPCPLCKKIPEDIFHIILDCKFVKVMWRRIEKTLYKIIPKPVTVYEKAFGIYPLNKTQIRQSTLRNFLTFSLRHEIMQEERKAYYKQNYIKSPEESFFRKFNQNMKQTLRIKKSQYDFQGLPKKFKKITTINNVVGVIKNSEYIWNDIM